MKLSIKNLSIKQKMFGTMAIMIIVSLVMMGASYYGNIAIENFATVQAEKILKDQLKEQLKVLTNALKVSVHAQIKNLQSKDIQISMIKRAVSEIRYEADKSGYFFVYEGDIARVMGPKPSMEGKSWGHLKDTNGVQIITEVSKIAEKPDGGFVTYLWPNPGAKDPETPVEKVSYAILIPGTKMWIGTGVYTSTVHDKAMVLHDEIDVKVKSIVMKTTVTLIILFTILISLFLILNLQITRAFKTMISNVKDLASGEGDLTFRFKHNNKDEIGELYQWLNEFIEKIQNIIKRLTKNSKDINDASTNLSDISTEMSTSIEDISNKSNSVAAAAEEMSTNMNSVAAAVEESTTNINMVASASEEMSSTINEISVNCENTRTLMGKAKEIVGGNLRNIEQLSSAANEISKITEGITDISEQTNLLALNATIEAARAGEAGKGFAVVAGEIKDLANRTAELTNQAKEKLDAVNGFVKSTNQGINDVAGSAGEVAEIVNTIASAVTQQSAATQEISNNISQAAQGLQEVSNNVQQSSQVASETAQDITAISNTIDDINQNSTDIDNNSTELSETAQGLNETVNQFKIE